MWIYYFKSRLPLYEKVFGTFIKRPRRKHDIFKLRANGRTQRLPTLCGQQCWKLLRPCWQRFANGCNNFQQCWGPQCIVGRIQPVTMGNALVWSRRCWKGCANWSNIREFKIPRRRRPRKRHSKSEFALFQTPRRSRAVTAKKCTKKRGTRAELLFCLFNLLLFWRSRCRRRRGILKSLLLRYATAIAEVHETLGVLGWKVWPVSNFAQQLPQLATASSRVCKRTQHVTAKNVASSRGFTSGNDMLTSYVKRLLLLWLHDKSRLLQL